MTEDHHNEMLLAQEECCGTSPDVVRDFLLRRSSSKHGSGEPYSRNRRDDEAVAMTVAEFDRCPACGGLLSWKHDHRPDNSGLDDGPYLPGQAPRKKSAPKPAAEIREIRTRAWSTRRAKYGKYGHR